MSMVPKVARDLLAIGENAVEELNTALFVHIDRQYTA
jgi:hypothetical protein